MTKIIIDIQKTIKFFIKALKENGALYNYIDAFCEFNECSREEFMLMLYHKVCLAAKNPEPHGICKLHNNNMLRPVDLLMSSGVSFTWKLTKQGYYYWLDTDQSFCKEKYGYGRCSIELPRLDREIVLKGLH